MREVELRNGDEGFRVLGEGNWEVAIFTVLGTFDQWTHEDDNVNVYLCMTLFPLQWFVL